MCSYVYHRIRMFLYTIQREDVLNQLRIQQYLAEAPSPTLKKKNTKIVSKLFKEFWKYSLQ